jgi:rubrerythrin
MTKSYDDLMAAFAGESQANRKYLAFAKKADEDGFSQVAKLFRAVAAAETVHAHNHFRAAGEIKTTEENLKNSIAGEHYENSEMYPAFIKDAEADGDKKALRSFNFANDVEKVHEELYRAALENLGKAGETYDYYICPVCGYTHARTAPEVCPICGTPGIKFEKVG